MRILFILLGVLSIIMLLVLFLYLIIGNSVYHSIFTRNSKRKKKIENNYKKDNRDDKALQNYFKNNFERLVVKNESVDLIGYYKNNQSKKLVILLHGFGGSHLDMIQYIDLFNQLDYDILVTDNRCHGESEGKYITLGKEEKEDLRIWIDKMIEIKHDYKIVLFGLDFSATSICLLLGQEIPHNVVLAIENGGFDNADKILKFIYSKHKMNSLLLYKLFTNYAKKTRNIDLKQINAVSSLKKSKIPIMFIHEQRDSFVPVEMMYKLSAVVPDGRKEIYLIDGVGNENLYAANQTYKRMVKGFLERFHM